MLRAPGLSPTTNPAYVRHDDELGWSYEPGARARHATDEFDVEIAINQRGFRGDEWPVERPAEHAGRRVLVLGDSFAFGWGVSEVESFPARLRAAQPQWRVFNAAVSGYATDQELLLARRLVPELAPDVVVCVFCTNDLWEADSEVVYGKHKPRFDWQGDELVLTGVPVPRSLLERTSALYRAWTKKRWEHEFELRPRDRRVEWRRVCELYRALHAAAGTATLLIVSGEERLAALAREGPGIEHLDLRTVHGPAAGSVAFARDGHWNARGHALVAAELERLLLGLR